MDLQFTLTLLVLVIGFYMAWNIGANDVSNAIASSVGSGALTWKQAVIFAAILEFCGAYFVGERVTKTVERGVINTELFLHDPMILVLGMCGALLGTSLWLQIASFFKWPVSTTHAIIGAISGFGIFISGWGVFRWREVISIILSWVISPVASALISYLIFLFLQKKILFALHPIRATKKFFPLFCFVLFTSLSLNLTFNGFSAFSLYFTFAPALLFSLSMGGLAALISYPLLCYATPLLQLSPPPKMSQEEKTLQVSIQKLLRKGPPDTTAPEYRFVEKVFLYLQIISAGYVAFAHGANDVSNAVGPVAAVLSILKNGGKISASTSIPSWLLLLGGAGIVTGLLTWGWRIIETVGKKITALTPTRGFCAEFGAATTILLASKMGLPISTTHCLVGAVLGVGLARGISAINLGMIQEIVLSWMMTIPASAFMSIICFYLLRLLFL